MVMRRVRVGALPPERGAANMELSMRVIFNLGVGGRARHANTAAPGRLLLALCPLLALPACSGSRVGDVPAERRSAHVERVEHYTEPNDVDRARLLLDTVRAVNETKRRP